MVSESTTSSSLEELVDLFGSMAAADLLIMALYFGALSIMISSTTLKRWFPGRGGGEEQEEATRTTTTRSGEELKSGHTKPTKELSDLEKTDWSARTKQTKQERQSDKGCSSVVTIVLSGILASCITWGVVELSMVLEKAASVLLPGLGCGAIAILITGINRMLNAVTQQKKRFQRLGGSWVFPIMERFDQVTAPLSAFCFQLLFAAIGVSANVQSIAQSGFSSFVFAALALCIHMATLLIGSKAIVRLLEKCPYVQGLLPLSLEEVLVASNAAIGGSATAAAFAGNIDLTGKGGLANSEKRGLVMSATIWGVIGYSIATSIGVYLSKQLTFVL